MIAPEIRLADILINLSNPKRLSRLADCDIAVNDIIDRTDSALLDIFLHRDTLKNDLTPH